MYLWFMISFFVWIGVSLVVLFCAMLTWWNVLVADDWFDLFLFGGAFGDLLLPVAGLAVVVFCSD